MSTVEWEPVSYHQNYLPNNGFYFPPEADKTDLHTDPVFHQVLVTFGQTVDGVNSQEAVQRNEEQSHQVLQPSQQNYHQTLHPTVNNQHSSPNNVQHSVSSPSVVQLPPMAQGRFVDSPIENGNTHNIQNMKMNGNNFNQNLCPVGRPAILQSTLQQIQPLTPRVWHDDEVHAITINAIENQDGAGARYRKAINDEINNIKNALKASYPFFGEKKLSKPAVLRYAIQCIDTLKNENEKLKEQNERLQHLLSNSIGTSPAEF